MDVRCRTIPHFDETADNKQTKIAATYLSGVAKTWYINTYGNKNTVTSLEDFLKAFKNFFLSATETQDVYSSIENLKQGKCSAKESITEYKLLSAQLTDPPLNWTHYTFIKGLDRKFAATVVNDFEAKNDLDTICTKTLKKAAVA